MCLIVAASKPVLHKVAVLQQAAAANPDGAGLMWATRGRLHTLYGLTPRTVDRVIAKACAIGRQGHPHVLHFRLATHGAVSRTNAHPMIVGPWGVAHNGILHAFRPPPKSTRSDTHIFVYECLARLPLDWYRQEAYRRLVSASIGTSKLAVLDRTGRLVLFNEESGVWADGAWYSNTNAFPRPRLLDATPRTVTSWKDHTPVAYLIYQPPDIRIACWICGVVGRVPGIARGGRLTGSPEVAPITVTEIQRLGWPLSETACHWCSRFATASTNSRPDLLWQSATPSPRSVS